MKAIVVQQLDKNDQLRNSFLKKIGANLQHAIALMRDRPQLHLGHGACHLSDFTLAAGQE